jgi:hypothetical protein
MKKLDKITKRRVWGNSKPEDRVFWGAERHKKNASSFVSVVPIKNILMGDRIIVEGRWCGNKLRDCPVEYLQQLVDTYCGTATERKKILEFLKTK